MERAHSAWGTNANIHSLMVEGVSVLWGAVLRYKAISPHRRTFLVCLCGLRAVLGRHSSGCYNVKEVRTRS